MGQKHSFIFLPDISGFTEFVSNTEVEHSQHIVAELLELLIDNDALGLTLAEIEGDALFYYKTDYVPSPQELINQVENLYVLFHSHLKQYEKRRICNCGACSTANELTLKFIAHAGPLDFIQIKDQRKPYGKEVITAHRLMKNTIPMDDYLLVSEGIYNTWSEQIKTDLPSQASQSTYDLGVVEYQYYELIPLKDKAKLPDLNLQKSQDSKTLASAEILVNKKPEDVFELITNFKYRMKWSKGIDDFKYEENRVNRLGTKHMCVLNGSLIEFETVTKDSEQQKLVYGERTQDVPVIKPLVTYFIVEEEQGKSRVTIEGVTESNSFLMRLLKPLLKRKLRKTIKEVLDNFKVFAETFSESMMSQEHH